MSWFYSSLTEEKAAEIVSFNTARDIWESLRRSYESTSSSRILNLKSQIQRIKKDGLIVAQFLAKIKDVAEKLSSIGEPVPVKDHISYILEGLRPEYNAFVTSVQHRSELPTIEDVRALLLAYEYRLESQTSVDQLNNLQANFAGFKIQGSPSLKRGGRSPSYSSRPSPSALIP